MLGPQILFTKKKFSYENNTIFIHNLRQFGNKNLEIKFIAKSCEPVKLNIFSSNGSLIYTKFIKSIKTGINNIIINIHSKYCGIVFIIINQGNQKAKKIFLLKN
jgi:hypothetical protein